MDTAVVFPGMAPTKFEDAGRFLLINPMARALLAQADEALGYSLFDKYAENRDDDYSAFAQAAFLVSSLAMAQWAEAEHGIRADACVGPSFGAKAAVVYSGALGLADVLTMTMRMAECEQKYFAEHHSDLITHTVARIPAADLAEVLADLERVGERSDISCYVEDDMYMVTLREQALDAFVAGVRRAGGMSFYSMKPPMHCELFGGLRDRIEAEVLADYSFADPGIAVFADQDGTAHTTADGIRTLLLDGIVRPVRWPETLAALGRHGVRRLCVAGYDGMWGRVRAATGAFEIVPANPGMAMRPRRRDRAAAAVK